MTAPRLGVRAHNSALANGCCGIWRTWGTWGTRPMRNVPHHVVWVKVADLPWKVELRNIPSHLFRGICQRVFNVLNKYLFTFAFDSGSSRSSGPGPGQLSIAEHFHVVSGFGLRVRGGWVRHLSSTLELLAINHS